jgi:hypothetical protein
MLLLHKSNSIFFLLFVGIAQLTTTNAFLPSSPANNVRHQTTNFHGKSFPRNIAKQEERTSNFQKIRVGKHGSDVIKISAATTDDDSETEEGQAKAKLLGTLVLLTVPLSWGTYVPVGESIFQQSIVQNVFLTNIILFCSQFDYTHIISFRVIVRYLYTIQPPVPGFVFSACYYTLAAATTSFLAYQLQSPSITSSEMEEDAGTLGDDDDFSIQSIIPFKGGIELGLYLFVANCLQVIGLETVESDRAGFLVQLTTVMVPICEGLFAGSVFLIPVRTWGACVMAFLGLCIMGLDGKTDAVLNNDSGQSLLDVAFSLSQGDALILGAAVLYTLHVVRLGTYARQTTPMKLAASKATTESILSFALIFFLMGLSFLQDTYHILDATGNNGLLSFSVKTGQEITLFFSSFTAGISDGSISTSILLPAFGSILWTGMLLLHPLLFQREGFSDP